MPMPRFRGLMGDDARRPRLRDLGDAADGAAADAAVVPKASADARGGERVKKGRGWFDCQIKTNKDVAKLCTWREVMLSSQHRDVLRLHPSAVILAMAASIPPLAG